MKKLFFPFLMTLLACLWLVSLWVGLDRRNRPVAQTPKAQQIVDDVRLV